MQIACKFPYLIMKTAHNISLTKKKPLKFKQILIFHPFINFNSIQFCVHCSIIAVFFLLQNIVHRSAGNSKLKQISLFPGGNAIYFPSEVKHKRIIKFHINIITSHELVHCCPCCLSATVATAAVTPHIHTYTGERWLNSAVYTYTLLANCLLIMQAP